MDVNIVKEALIAQRKIGLNGSLYHKTQIEFAYNTNHIEGSTITPDETAIIYDTGTILSNSDKVIVLKDATETKNHFTLLKYMLDTLDELLKWYQSLKKITLEDIIDFHYRFECIHPFSDENDSLVKNKLLFSN